MEGRGVASGRRPSVVISFTGKTMAEEMMERREKALGILPEEPPPPLVEERVEKKPWWKKLFS